MTYQEFTSRFKSQVSNLTREGSLSFALDICKKLFPDYQKFSKSNSWGDPDVLLEAIDFIENRSMTRPKADEIIDVMEKVDAVTPDTSDFEDASFALNACTSIFYTLDYLVNNDPDSIFHVGSSLYDSVYCQLKVENPSGDEGLDQHPNMEETRKYLLKASA